MIMGEKEEGKVEELHYECKFHRYRISMEGWFSSQNGGKVRFETTRDMNLLNATIYSIKILQEKLNEEVCRTFTTIKMELQNMTKENWENKRNELLQTIPIAYLGSFLKHQGATKELQFYLDLCKEKEKHYKNITLIYSKKDC